MHYLETDTILYVPVDPPPDLLMITLIRNSFPDETPAPLVRLQKQHWDPLYAWVKDEFGVVLSAAEGLAPARQSADTVGKLRGAVEGMDHWELAGKSSSFSPENTLSTMHR